MEREQILERNIEELNHMYTSSLTEISNLRVKLNFCERKEIKKDETIRLQAAKIIKLDGNVK